MGARTLVRHVREESARRLSARDPSLRGDLETVVHHALSKEPADRYQSVAEFVADLQRVLNDEPVTVLPPSSLYVLRKFAKRHTAPFALACVLFVSLSVFSVVMGMLFSKATHAEKLSKERLAEANVAHIAAQREAAKARLEATKAWKITELMQDVVALQTARLHHDDADFQSATTIAWRIDDEIARNLTRYPEIESQLRKAVARACGGIGMFRVAENNLRRALAIETRMYGAKDYRVGQTIRFVGQPGPHEFARVGQEAMTDSATEFLAKNGTETG